MKTASTITAWLLLGALCVAAQPKSVISGPHATKSDSLILNSTGSVFDLYEPEWYSLDPSVELGEFKDGRLYVHCLTQLPYSTSVLLFTWGSNSAANSPPLHAVAQWPVTFGSSSPDPGPNPPPGPSPPQPAPTPSLPDGKFKLAAFAYNAAMQIAQPARGDAPRIATAIGSVATANASNSATGYDAVKAAGDQLNAALNTAFGSDAPAWNPWYLAVQGQVRNLYGQNNGINSVPDFCIAMNEISNGVGQAQ